MSNVRLKNAVLNSTYREVVAFSDALGGVLNVNAQNRHKIAEALTRTAEEIPSIYDDEVNDADVINGHFNRKRALTIQPDGDGFRICSAGVPDVVCTNIRDGMQDFFDVMVTYKRML